MRSRRHHRLGFTLIELMMVVAVIAILSLLALPSFRDRIARQQVSQALEDTAFAQKTISAAYPMTGLLPPDNAKAGLPPADRIVSKFLSSVTVRDGALELVFGNSADALLMGRKLTLRPATVDGYPQVPLVWVCAAGPVPDKMTVHGRNDTTIAPLYLPLACRAMAPKKPA